MSSCLHRHLILLGSSAKVCLPKSECCQPLVLAMSPKKVLNSVVKQSAADKRAEQAAKELSDQTKKDQSNLVTQLKKAETPDKVALYNIYSQLAKNSSEKAIILQKWLQDKSCKWVKTYMKGRNVSQIATFDEVCGWGSKFRA